MKIVALVAVHIALAAAKHTEIQARFSTEVGSAGVDVQELNSHGERKGGVFFDLSFSTQGLLAEWQFFAVARGEFYADVWDVDYVNNVATLMGSNKLQAEVLGFQSVEVPPMERLHVEPGYAIGIHYADGDGDSVLSWERQPETSGVQVSLYHLLDLYHSDLPNGKTVPTEANGKASPALKGILVGPNPNLRLVPEEDYRKGRVEVKLGDQWGTVCDKWFEVTGWPNLFCTEMGFPGAEYANYTDSDNVGIPGDWTRYQVPMSEWPSTPIQMHSPRCKLSDNREFMSCVIHPNGECNHRMDMYVECLPRMRCGYNRTRIRFFKKHEIRTTSCVPEIYQDGSWGYVGDTRPISDFKDNHKTWLAAFCKEIGYDNVKRVEYVNAQVGNFKPKHPVTYCDPTCNVPEPTRIGQCKPGPLVDGCHDIDKVFYIYCETKILTGWERPLRTGYSVEERQYRRKAKRAGVPEDEIEKKMKEMKEKREQEERERQERERQEREQREREEREREEREQREREERERQEREQREREEREKQEREWNWEGNPNDKEKQDRVWEWDGNPNEKEKQDRVWEWDGNPNEKEKQDRVWEWDGNPNEKEKQDRVWEWDGNPNEKEKQEREWEWEWGGNGKDGMTDEERRAARQAKRNPDKAIQEQEEKERLQKEQEEKERLEREQREKEERERLEREQREKEERERLEREQREKEERERLEREQREQEEKERLEREQREQEERERLEREQREQEERERLEKEQREQEERERLEKEQREQEERERLEREKQEREWAWEGNGKDGMTEQERREARQARRNA